MKNTTLLMVEEELNRARGLNGPMASAHEAYAVILEELDEFWELVKLRRSQRDPERMCVELVQVAAMAVRAIEDLNLRGAR